MPDTPQQPERPEGLPAALRMYDRDGQRVTDMYTFNSLLADREYAVIHQDDVLTADGRTLWVSTVWLGIDHRFFGDGPPLIFETAIFEVEGRDEYMCRYSTEQDARVGHRQIVELLHQGTSLADLGALTANQRH